MKRTASNCYSELFARCTYQEWLQLLCLPNYRDFINTALEINTKYKFDAQRKNRWLYACGLAFTGSRDKRQINEFYKLFEKNNINPKKFALDVIDLLTCTHYKKNTLKLHGAPNSCKSLIAKFICEPFLTCHINNHNSENEFYLSNAIMKVIIWADELFLTPATAEDFKGVLGGQPVDISQKYVSKQVLERTPVIITSNYDKFGRGHLPDVDEIALNNRCYIYRFTIAFEPAIKLNFENFYYFLTDNV